ncbi:HD family phosphohydrolase [Salisediminibacterium beveridgei]|uniref:HD/PDEase domain-containing protein n=1 Tax=Salisediminibacterium beveridgei TaxID=632773 RepID=A0A1D7QUC8_9BACI|nr:HD family phosphohydrolase [Salisediminibacterium beveridgei]AOM82589.1 hypothetical protein BBEV_1221 [Salisediminibacterium beveridgei]
MSKRSPIDQQKWWKKIRDHRYSRMIIFSVLALVTYLMLFSNVVPDYLDIEPGLVSEQDIHSPLTIEHKTETDRLAEEAVDDVEPVYAMKPRYAQNQIERIQDLFQRVQFVRDETLKTYESFESEQENRDNNNTDEDPVTNFSEEVDYAEFDQDEMLAMLRGELPQEINDQLSDDTLVTLLTANEDQLQLAREASTSAVHDVMSEEIKMDEVTEAKEEAEEIVRNTPGGVVIRSAITDIVRYGVTANYMIDEEATADARQQAIENIEPSMIREGQIIVEEGQVITADIYQQLSTVGLTEEVNYYYPFIGLAIIVLLITVMLAYYLGDAKTSLKTNNTHLLMYLLIYTITLSIMKLSSFLHQLDIGGIQYLVPAAAGTMLITVLIHSRVALFSGILFSMIASIMFNDLSSSMFDASQGLFVFFSCLAGIFYLIRSQSTMRMLNSGMVTSGVSILTVAAILMLKNAQYGWIEISFNLGFAALAGIIAAILAIGILPFLETAFGILSTSRLIELSNPNHPLLRKILLEAPGTYHHSVMVANLSESACEAIGANGLLARVASYYHDIGKTRRPHFFIENQMGGKNPHDNLSPQLSKTIITAHPYDGAEMLRSHKMPKEIIDIAEQHHGTTCLKYFYYKAKEDDPDIKMEDFRYPGPIPNTKVSAVVGIADSVEAAVRSMKQPTIENIDTLVRKIINDRLDDDQFDECDLTIKELHKVAKSMLETLQGTFHSRIEYPDDTPTDQESSILPVKKERAE